MKTLKKVSVDKKSFTDYRKFNPALYNETLENSKSLKGKVVIHVNATPVGGGVAEMLKSQVSLEEDLGIRSFWYALSNVKSKFFETTKNIHNLLQGERGALTDEEKKLYLRINKGIGKDLLDLVRKSSADLVVIHDPQPLAAITFIKSEVPAVLRLHIDLSTPNRKTLKFLKEYITEYDEVVVSRSDYKFKWIEADKMRIIYPAIDPLSEKNKPLSGAEAKSILRKFQVDTSKPVIAQVSRFDPWKDPIGVIRAYKKAKKQIEDLQLILVGFAEAKDDPEAARIFKEVQIFAGSDPDIFLFSDLKVLKGTPHSLFINAVQTASDVILQKSIREGFGMTVTEAMWKKTPVIGGDTPGIRVQIENGENGFLVSDFRGAAEYIVQLMRDKKFRKQIGSRAHKSVKHKFLLPRLTNDHLLLYNKLINPYVKVFEHRGFANL